MAEQVTITFTKERDTKNTIRYQEDQQPGQPPRIGTLYLQNWFAAGREKVTITVE